MSQLGQWNSQHLTTTQLNQTLAHRVTLKIKLPTEYYFFADEKCVLYNHKISIKDNAEILKRLAVT